MSEAVSNRLDLSTDSSSEVSAIKKYLKLPPDVTVDYDLIEGLIDEAKADVDSYLHNDFEQIKPEITFDNPENGEWLKIEGQFFYKQSSTSVADSEFADEDGLVSCINSGIVDVGIQYLTAENDSGTVILTPDQGHIEDIEVLASKGLQFTIVRRVHEVPIPKPVKQGVRKLVANMYFDRVGGLEAENQEHGGSGSMQWGKIKREYLQPYRSMNV